jgi:hypothetical protein
MKFRTHLLVGALAVSSALMYVGNAKASTVRIHSSACFEYYNGDWTDSHYSPTQSGSSSGMEMMCPAPDSDVVPKADWYTVNVEMYLAGTNNSAGAVCRDYWDGSGGNCTSTRTATGSGHQTLSFGATGYNDVATEWTSSDASDFGYLYLDIGYNNDARGIYYYCTTTQGCPNNN